MRERKPVGSHPVRRCDRAQREDVLVCSLVVNKLRVAFGRKTSGVDFKAIDEKPVNFFFLIVAPPLEVSNQYLPVLGKIAQFSKESDVPQRLVGLTENAQFLKLLEEKGV